MTRPRLLDLFSGAGGAAVGYHMLLAPTCRHTEQGQPLGVYGTGGGGQMTRGRKATRIEAPEAMGIDWMTHRELSQAIPSVYTQWIGCALLAHLQETAA